MVAIVTLAFVAALGLLGFFVLPVASSLTANWKWPADLSGWLGMRSIGRAAFVLTEHDELLFKRMSFKDIGVERISFDDESKDFDDPAAALSHWKGFPFALADEVSGVLFDPRHSAVGAVKREYEQKDLAGITATKAGFKAFEVASWGPAVLELPSERTLVDLSGVRALLGGGERAEYPKRIEELYKLSREPMQDDRSSLRPLVPVAALIATVGAMYFISSQMGESASGGTTIGWGSVGSLGVLALVGGGDRDWKPVIRKLSLACFALAPAIGLVGFLGVIDAVLVTVAFAVGFVAIPALALFLGGISSRVGAAFTELFMRMQLLGYRRPVWEWTPTGYELREGAAMDSLGNVNWYRFKGELVGFTFDPDDAFGSEEIGAENVEGYRGAVTDGGDPTAPAVPEGWQPAEALCRGPYGGMVPKQPDANKLYLRTSIAIKHLSDAAMGEKTLSRLLLAKEKFGSGRGGLSDKFILGATLGMAIFGFVASVLLFF